MYSLFGSKEALLDAVVDDAFSRFAAHLATVRETEDPREDLLRLGRAYRAGALADPHSYWIMFGTTSSRVAVSAGVRDRAAATFEPLRGIVRRAVQQEVLRPADPEQLASAMWATVHGAVSLDLAGLLGGTDPAELFESAMRAAIDGWAPARNEAGAEQT